MYSCFLECQNNKRYSSISSLLPNHRLDMLGRIQDLTKGGSDKRPPKAVAPRGVFNFRASEMRFPAFSGAI